MAINLHMFTRQDEQRTLERPNTVGIQLEPREGPPEEDSAELLGSINTRFTS